MKNKIDYKITDLVTDDYNKSIVFYGINDNAFMVKVLNYLTTYIKDNPDTGISKYIITNEAGRPIISINRMCIDFMVDDYFDEDYLIELLEEINV